MTPSPNTTKAMPLGQHLQELRHRTLASFAGIAILTPVGWIIGPAVFDWILLPLADSASPAQLNFNTVMGPLDLRIQLSLALAVVLAAPWWIYQLGAYIGPGLKRRERAYALWFGIAGTALFASGVTAGIYAIPHAVGFLLSFTPESAALLLSPSSYLRFYLQVTIGFGLSFLLPVVLVALNFLGVVSAGTLLKAWRVAVIVCFALAAVINPLPSALPMIAQSMVLLTLYFIAVGIAYLHQGRRSKHHPVA